VIQGEGGSAGFLFAVWRWAGILCFGVYTFDT